MKFNIKKTLTIIGIIIPTILSILMVFEPLSQAFYVRNGDIIYSWLFEWLATLYPLFLIISLLSAFGLTYASKKQFFPEDGILSKVVLGITPLVWLFPCVWMSYASEWIGVIVAALFIPIGFSIVVAIVIDNLFFKYFNTDPSPKLTKIWVLISVIVYACFFFIYFQKEVKNVYSSSAGGDVKHYVTMHKSLINDGNLDLTNELKEIQKELNCKDNDIGDLARKSHMKKNLEGKYYSYHSFGLPILSYLFASLLGEFGITILIVLIAVMAMLGCFKTALISGGNKRTAFILSWLLVLSCGWIFTGVAFLPEMLGLALTAWGFWCIFALEKKDLRCRASYLLAICAGYLPYAHIRFAPISLLLAFLFGIEYVFFVKDEKFGSKLRHLIPAIIIYACFGFYLLHCHNTMYSGGSAYKYDRVLFGYPIAMWLVLCAQRSLGSVMPCVFGMLAAIPFVLSRGGKKTRFALYALCIFTGILTTCCSTNAALGGACVPGRYLMHCIPILLPIAVIAISEAIRIARLLYFSIALLPVFAFFVMGRDAKKTTGAFIRLPEKIHNFASFENLLDPFASKDVLSTEFLAGSIFVGGIIICFVILYFSSISRIRKLFIVIGCTILCVAMYYGFTCRDHVSEKRARNGYSLVLDKYRYFRFASGTSVDAFDLFCRGEEMSLFQYGSGFKTHTSRTYNCNAIPVNDWAGRNRRWIDVFLNLIRYADNGGVAIYLKGKVEGGAAFCQFRQGAHDITEEIILKNTDIEGVWLLPIKKGRGFLHCFVSLENADVKMSLEKALYIPYSKYFRKDVFRLPEGVPVYDLREK